MSRLRVGVFGGAGFIGNRLARRLVEEGHEVVIADIAPAAVPGAEHRFCDVCDLPAVRSVISGLDVVYNLAAEHRDDVRPLERYSAVNVDGARNVCQAASDEHVDRIVFTSSVAVYGLPDGPAAEDAPCRPFNEYGRTKLEAERIYHEWALREARRSLVIVRPTVVFGEGNRGNVYNLARQIADGRFVMIGDGRNRKSIAYVENVAGFLVHVIRAHAGVEVFNYADTPDLDMNTLVATMRTRLGKPARIGIRVPFAFGMAIGRALDGFARVTGKSFPISSVRVQKFCSNTQIVADRALRSGYSPVFTIESAVERFFASEFGRA